MAASERDTNTDGAEEIPPPVGERPLVDVTLIDEALRLSPEERLRENDRMATTIVVLRAALGVADDDGP